MDGFPTNDEGMFEVVDEDGVVVGHGVVIAGPMGDTVDFAYGDGVHESRVIMAAEQFQAVWRSLPVAHLTVRAAA